MIIEEEFTLPGAREEVADLLLDVVRVQECLPGVGDVNVLDDDTYEATLAVRMGPVKASFKGRITVDRSSAPARLTAAGEGQDRSTGSMAQVAFEADLEERAGQTVVATQADVRIRGKLGQFGTGVIRSTATEMVREFAGCVSAKLEEDRVASDERSAGDDELVAVPPRPVSTAGRDSASRRAPSVWRALGRGVLSYLGSAIARVIGEAKRRMGRS